MSYSPKVIIVGGPAGTGKTTTAQLLANHFQCPFLEGDDLHPEANVNKMARGEPLNDDDRWDWLERLSKEATKIALDPSNLSGICVASCSMLKKIYREHLQKFGDGVQFRFVFLHTSIEKLTGRVAARQGHFMKLAMVQLQYDIMEIPEGSELVSNGGLAVSVEMSDMTPSEVESYVLKELLF